MPALISSSTEPGAGGLSPRGLRFPQPLTGARQRVRVQGDLEPRPASQFPLEVPLTPQQADEPWLSEGLTRAEGSGF